MSYRRHTSPSPLRSTGHGLGAMQEASLRTRLARAGWRKRMKRERRAEARSTRRHYAIQTVKRVNRRHLLAALMVNLHSFYCKLATNLFPVPTTVGDRNIWPGSFERPAPPVRSPR